MVLAGLFFALSIVMLDTLKTTRDTDWKAYLKDCVCTCNGYTRDFNQQQPRLEYLQNPLEQPDYNIPYDQPG